MKHMLNLGIQTLSHYIPLHNSVGGKKFGKTSGSFDQTLRASDCLLRLPIWPGLSHAQQDYIIDSLRRF